MELALPGMDGLEAFTRIREESRGTVSMTNKHTHSALLMLAIGLCGTISCIDEDAQDVISDQAVEEELAAALESTSCSVGFLKTSCTSSGSVSAHPTDHSIALTVVCPTCSYRVRDTGNGHVVRSGIGYARTRIPGLFGPYRVEISSGVFGNWALISNVDP